MVLLRGLAILFMIVFCSVSYAETEFERKQKLLSLFSVVTFPNRYTQLLHSFSINNYHIFIANVQDHHHLHPNRFLEHVFPALNVPTKVEKLMETALLDSEFVVYSRKIFFVHFLRKAQSLIFPQFFRSAIAYLHKSAGNSNLNSLIPITYVSQYFIDSLCF